jgi:hypothetical protein
MGAHCYLFMPRRKDMLARCAERTASYWWFDSGKAFTFYLLGSQIGIVSGSFLPGETIRKKVI